MNTNGQAWLKRHWRLPAAPPDGLSLWEKILHGRGYDTAEKRSLLLNTACIDPFLFSDMERAVEIVDSVLRENGRIVVFGDYDADGLTATAILVRLFRRLGASVSWIIPDRLDEGYGLGDGHVERLTADPPALVVTVDCGSNSRNEVAALKAAGMRVIVTDHHVVDQPPDGADAHINPRAEDAVDDLLAGAGVAYCLAEAYLLTVGSEDAEAFLETLRVLAAVGTIADIMPLTGANRALVKAGLGTFRQAAPVGLRLLLPGTDVPDANAIAFTVAPALNAASRLGEAETALALLLTDRAAEAAGLAQQLADLNARRRRLEAEIAAEALHQAERIAYDASVLVVRGEHWHTGVLGIVAARLTEQFGKPAIVLNKDGDEWQGSARSLPGIDIHALLAAQAAMLIRFGGHMRAAGLSVADSSYDRFAAAMAGAKLPASDAIQPLAVDVMLSPDDLVQSELDALSVLEPCGEGQPEPLAAALGCKILSIRPIGQGRHTRLEVDFHGLLVTALMFRRGDLTDLYAVGDTVDLAGRPGWHVFRQLAYPQLILSDIRPALRHDTAYDDPLGHDMAADDAAPCTLDARVFEQAYRLLFDAAGYGEHVLSPVIFAKRLARAYNMDYSGLAVVLAFRVLAEAGMLHCKPQEDGLHMTVRLIEAPKRASLRATPTWQALEAKGWLNA